jgi:hydrogenase/urease accessory protein HupE
MEALKIWFVTGFEHILDFEGYDHICYVVALTILYNYTQWRKLLWLVTAFTVGHSVSLALSVTDTVVFPAEIIEILIPITIILTCLTNIIFFEKKDNILRINYFIALFFGLIHGLGFSYLLKVMLGKEESIVLPLFNFNIGLEVGQLLIVGVTLLGTKIVVEVLKVKLNVWVKFVSCLVLLVATFLLFDRL